MKRKIFKMIKRTLLVSAALILICLAVFSRAIPPALAFIRQDEYKVSYPLTYHMPAYDPSKKTIVIVADKDGTEIFDMMAPFYLFNSTEKANVYIVAEKLEPVAVRKGFFVLPQLSFAQVDSMKLPIDVIVVPNQSVMVGMKQKKATVNFIKSHYTGANAILSVCDGSATVSATGIYDGQPLTTHSSDYEAVKKQYPKPAWEQGVRVTRADNLFSTAGVANATEGSLTLIRELFGDSTLQKVMSDIHYPAKDIRNDHQNLIVTTDAIFIAVRKGAFKSNERVGVLMRDGVNEFDLAGTLDTYTRSFPASLESFTPDGKPVISRYGLTLLPTGETTTNQCTELHLPQGVQSEPGDQTLFPKAKLVKYDQPARQYILDECLSRIESLYGKNFAHTVRLMLDYN